FSTNFAFTYSDNLKNFTQGSSMGADNIIGMALNMAPNMSVYRQDKDGNDTDEYMIMNPVVNGMTPADGNYTSQALADVRKIGNPVAYANLAWKRQKIYQITPDFNLKYELLGTGNDQHRLTFDGRVYFDVYAQSTPTYLPGMLMATTWNDQAYNQATNTETNQLKIGARTRLTFTPHFKNEDFYFTMFAQYELLTTKYNSQYVLEYELPNGIEASNVTGALGSLSSSNSRSATHNWLVNTHFSYKGRYSLGFSLRADGNSKFGPEKPWFYSPSVSLRYNVSDEKFFEPLKKVVSMFGIRTSWGITGSSSAKDYSFFNSYSANGTYGKISNLQTAMLLSGLKLDELIPQKKIGYNLGFNLGFLNDMFEVDVNLYSETTKDLQMSNITIPSITGYSSLATGNIGKMRNKGWDISLSANKFVKYKKFSMSANFNIAQNQNELLEMDERVLRSLNGNDEYTYTNRGSSSRMDRVQVGNALCSIYGYRYKGVYQYSYQWLTNQQKEHSWDAATYEEHINQWLSEGKTFPIATDANGRVIMNSNGTPQRLVYNYELSSDGASGTTLYSFDGGDAIY
ncbi:MAG: TonB-dependent receptor, partial [Prevotellaceae bacterium]|nr:TonB-dependent receptor [Prevotellaceae bacterium]